MNSVNYIFLIKDDIIVPQSLEEEYCGEIINSLIEQCFVLSDFNVSSPDSTTALKMYRNNDF